MAMRVILGVYFFGDLIFTNSKSHVNCQAENSTYEIYKKLFETISNIGYSYDNMRVPVHSFKKFTGMSKKHLNIILIESMKPISDKSFNEAYYYQASA